MNTPKSYFIPHPLCSSDLSVLKKEMEKQELESLDKYIVNSGNPRWAATHLVRAISKGLHNEDIKASDALREIANDLATRRPEDAANFKHPIEVAFNRDTRNMHSFWNKIVCWFERIKFDIMKF